ncbi:uncharacterized protein LOC113278941 [Papaver somniferum]|uniref:uncharacterized protein LOC113278941 n=1 Tax=Papaver somniferum TaxID=3469 RepID=UPI000E7014B4|nr:uncharacterized protein LOC113278941 [Papaver somniferum]
METHIKHLTITLELLKQHSLFAKLSKCSFGKSQIDYLGHIISGEGVAGDPEKIACMDYGIICKPLTELLKKNQFQWSDSAESAFQRLKEAVTTTPVLALPDFSKPFEVATGACDVGVGAALDQ